MRASKLAKIFDKYLGPLILFLFGLFRFKRSLPEQVHSIGLLKENAIGDAVLLTAVIKDIQKVYPQAQITVYLTESNSICRPLFEADCHVVTIPIKKPHQAIGIVRKAKHDIFIDYGAWPRINAMIAAFSKSKFIIGFNTPGQYRHYAFDLFAVHSNACHELQNYRILTVLIGVPRVQTPPLIIAEAKLPSEFEAKRYAIIHPWGGGDKGQLREWQTENWQTVINHLKSKNIEVFLSGAPSEASKNTQFQNANNIAGKYDFKTFMSILSQAQVVFSVNTGIMHLAAALAAPTIGLSGPTNTVRWGALGEKVINVHPNDKTCGFLNLGFEYTGQRQDCMQLISTQEVIQAANQFI